MKGRVSWQQRNHQPAGSNFFLDTIAKSREDFVLKQKPIVSVVPLLTIKRVFKIITRIMYTAWRAYAKYTISTQDWSVSNAQLSYRSCDLTPTLLVGCANFTPVVKQHETQILLCVKVFSGLKCKWWSIGVIKEMLSLSQTTVFLLSLFPAQTPFGSQKQDDGNLCI